MKIAFDAKRLFFNHTGLGNYSRSLVEQLRALNKQNEIFLFTPDVKKSRHNQFDSDHYTICEGKGRFLWRLKNMVKDIEKLDIDIYHGLSNELPVGISNLPKTKSIVTIHDLIFLRYPKYYPKVDRIIYREKSKRACRDADHIIAVSEATKDDIIEFYEVDPEKISVIYQTYDNIFNSEQTASIDVFREKTRQQILYVGSITERKNLKNLILALLEISESSRPMLKVVGKGGSYEKRMRLLVDKLDLARDVNFLGHVSNLELKSLYRNSSCLVYPSLAEGFGIPIIEALICGTPVITSNVSSMPEAASGLGHLVNPSSVGELHSAIVGILNSAERIDSDGIELIYKKFNAERQASEVLQLYEEVLKR